MMSHICFPLEPEEHEQVRKKQVRYACINGDDIGAHVSLLVRSCYSS